MEGQLFSPIPNNNSSMTELEMCKTALCFKEQELFSLRNDVQTQQMILQTLTQSFERLERTMSASMDRLARTVNRKRDASPRAYRNSNFNSSLTSTNANKRRRRDHN